MDFANARAVLKAHNDYRRMKSRYDGIQPDRNIMADFPTCRINIILAYHLRGKRTFSRL